MKSAADGIEHFRLPQKKNWFAPPLLSFKPASSRSSCHLPFLHPPIHSCFRLRFLLSIIPVLLLLCLQPLNPAMSTTRIFSTLARNVTPSSRHTLQRWTLPVAQQALPQLRSKSTLPSSLHCSLAQHVQRRAFRSTLSPFNDQSRCATSVPEVDPTTSSSDEETPSIPVTGQRTPIGQIEQRLAITFTCTVDQCGHRSTHEFSKRSYTKGIVIVQCPECKSRHLIADNLSWFTETEDDPRTIEQMIEAKGGKVRRGKVGEGDVTGETLEILS